MLTSIFRRSTWFHGISAVWLLRCIELNFIFWISFCPQAAETKNKDLEGRIEGLQMDMEDSQQKQGNMKGELKKFMDILDGKIDELHEFRQGLSKLGVDNWEKSGTELRGSEVRYEGLTTVCLQGRNYVAPTPPKWCPLRNNQLWLLINTTMWERNVLERESDTGRLTRRRASMPQQTAPFCALKLNQESHFELTFPFLWGEMALKSWWWVLRFCPSVFSGGCSRVEEGT